MRLDPPDYFTCNRCNGHMDNYFHGEDLICQFCLEDKDEDEDE
jgi:hypothetical protein